MNAAIDDQNLIAPNQRTLHMPNPSLGAEPVHDVHHNGCIVIVGANGSGKSRLGAWLENPASLIRNKTMATAPKRGAYRIGAQRVLVLPDRAQRMAAEQAAQQLEQGTDGPGGGMSRVQGDPVVGQTNDFGPLLNRLFADQAREAHEYMQRGHTTKGNPGIPPQSTLDKLKELWERIFPQRRLEFGDHIVQAKMAVSPESGKGDELYRASELSDGERVGFYLAAQVLLAPKDALLVIDEPELHLHESIQSAIWGALEGSRPDCVFVYITHDLGFAASRVGAAKVVLYDYIAPTENEDVGVWKWQPVPATNEIPEDVILRIIGSRRATLFVEGIVGNWDHKLYEVLLPNYYIVPNGGADDVIKAVRAFDALPHLHRYHPLGLIDLDDRFGAEIAALRHRGIHVLPVAGVENLLTLPECLEAFAATLSWTDDTARNAVIEDAKRRVINAMRAVRLRTIAKRASHAVRQRLSSVSANGHEKTDLIDAVSAAVMAAAPESVYDTAVTTIDTALDATDGTAYEATLRVFRNKGILEAAANAFQLQGRVFGQRIIDLIRTDEDLRAKVTARLELN